MTKIVTIQLEEILKILERYPEGLSLGEIASHLSFSLNNKTLQRRLLALLNAKKIRKEGERRGTKYFPLETNVRENEDEDKDIPHEIFSNESLDVLKFLDAPMHTRERMSYKREFLENYAPNETIYVPIDLREQLKKEGKRVNEKLAAGTYAKQISQRLLIDLSYNSSRLEGNTYSKLDTQRLIEDGITAEDKVHEETVMIMNHKEALTFLVENAEDIELNAFTIFNLHYLLSQDLLKNPESCGNIRKIEVDIGKSTYHPLNNPHLLKEYLELTLLKAQKITDPFEQSFFILVHISYLQAFEDVNKRTSRLSCNIPFIKKNLCPLSFTDLPRDDYTAALLAIYEKNEIGPMLELFYWAYLRSCSQYGIVKESLGDIDPYRIQYRRQRKEVMGQIIKRDLHGADTQTYIENYAQKNKIDTQDKFTAMTLTDLSNLHAGAIVGLGITPKELERWKNKSKRPKNGLIMRPS